MGVQGGYGGASGPHIGRSAVVIGPRDLVRPLGPREPVYLGCHGGARERADKGYAAAITRNSFQIGLDKTIRGRTCFIYCVCVVVGCVCVQCGRVRPLDNL